MSWHIQLGPRATPSRKNDMNNFIGRTVRGSYPYGRPPLPKGSTELPAWLLESLSQIDEKHYQVYHK